MLAQLPQPAIIAHRGASAQAPENTIPAFELAVRLGAHAVELDAKLTADGHVVVFHDARLERITGARGRVKKTSLAALRRLDAGSRFGEAYRGEKIPTLEEIFRAIGDTIMINVELTNYASPTDSLPQQAAELVRRYGLAGRVLFSSFNPLALLEARRALPDADLGLLAPGGFPGVLARALWGRLIAHHSLHLHHRDASPRLIARAHRRGQRVLAYTVNAVEDMRRLFSWGVDGIFTDDPALALQTLAESAA